MIQVNSSGRKSLFFKGVSAHRTGPSLAGVLGRQAGTAEGFQRYSGALRSADLVWREDTLNIFLADPQALLRGNRMTFPGLADAQVLLTVATPVFPLAAHSLQELEEQLSDREKYFQPVGKEAPEFTLEDAQGHAVSLEELGGSRRLHQRSREQCGKNARARAAELLGGHPWLVLMAHRRRRPRRWPDL